MAIDNQRNGGGINGNNGLKVQTNVAVDNLDFGLICQQNLKYLPQ